MGHVTHSRCSVISLFWLYREATPSTARLDGSHHHYDIHSQFVRWLIKFDIKCDLNEAWENVLSSILRDKLSLKYFVVTKSLALDRAICFNKSKSYFGFHTNINSGNLAVVAWIEYRAEVTQLLHTLHDFTFIGQLILLLSRHFIQVGSFFWFS